MALCFGWSTRSNKPQHLLNFTRRCPKHMQLRHAEHMVHPLTTLLSAIASSSSACVAHTMLLVLMPPSTPLSPFALPLGPGVAANRLATALLASGPAWLAGAGTASGMGVCSDPSSIARACMPCHTMTGITGMAGMAEGAAMKDTQVHATPY